ncbi:helix-turn-helix transcriptional regulator [Mesorhizobium marinum]|uniref:helix-turn-helix transcriptional regulator n=1 Tax=Mesorhizobium marinum TaxID=3228790 RepID=UPI0034664852
MKAAAGKHHPHPLALRPDELASRIGVSRRTLYNWLKHPDASKRLPQPFKMGRATLWRADAVLAWVAAQEARRG